jgi:hypothetical protein
MYRAIQYHTVLIAVVRYDNSDFLLSFFASLHISFPTAVRHNMFMGTLYNILSCLQWISVSSLHFCFPTTVKNSVFMRILYYILSCLQ